MRELYKGLLGAREEYEAAVRAVLEEALPPRAPAALHVDDIVDALGTSGSVLGMGPISEAIWRAGWPAVAEAIGRVARDAAAVTDPAQLGRVVHEAAMRVAGPAAPGDGLALAAYDEEAGMVILLSDYEPMRSTVNAFSSTVTVYGRSASGRWSPQDMLASTEADAEAAMDDALRVLMPTAFHDDPWSTSTAIPVEAARRAVAGDEQAADRCAAYLAAALAGQEAESASRTADRGATLADLAGTATEASRSMVARSPGDRAGSSIDRDV